MAGKDWRLEGEGLGTLAIALAISLLFILATVSHYGNNLSALIWLGEENASSHPGLVGPDIVVMKDSPGYDGQFFYFIAQDFAVPRREVVDVGRYQRIGYPLLASGLSLGQRDLLPGSLILVNLVAILSGT